MEKEGGDANRGEEKGERKRWHSMNQIFHLLKNLLVGGEDLDKALTGESNQLYRLLTFICRIK